MYMLYVYISIYIYTYIYILYASTLSPNLPFSIFLQHIQDMKHVLLNVLRDTANTDHAANFVGT